MGHPHVPILAGGEQVAMRIVLFTGSLATYDDQFCGLAIDHDNESGLTDERVAKWCAQIKQELEL